MGQGEEQSQNLRARIGRGTVSEPGWEEKNSLGGGAGSEDQKGSFPLIGNSLSDG